MSGTTSTSPDRSALGIDIGGTRLRAAVVAPDGTILERTARPTPAAVAGPLLVALGELVDEHPDLPVGIGIAGLVDPRGTVRYGPNIGIRDLPLARELGSGRDAPVVVANDASVAALAEQRVGVAAGCDDVVLMTLGTGVGGGIVIGGDVVLGSGGFAGELGHMVVHEGGRKCPCGNRGCIEAYASGSALGLITRERLVDPDLITSLRGIADPSGPDVTRAAADGDAVAVEVLTEVGGWLGVAMASLVNALDPEMIVLGGGAAHSVAGVALAPAHRSMAARLVGAAWRTPPPIELAALGDDAGVVGAALLAHDRANASPTRSA